MNWIHAFVELNKSLFLKGVLLLMTFLLGLQMGQSRLQRQWDAEKKTVQIAQAMQEQHTADVAQVQNQKSKEISDDYLKKSNLLASRFVVLAPERLFNKSKASSADLSAVSAFASRVETSTTNAVPDPAVDASVITCDQLTSDAAQTTLMLIEFQRWYREQALIVK